MVNCLRLYLAYAADIDRMYSKIDDTQTYDQQTNNHDLSLKHSILPN